MIIHDVEQNSVEWLTLRAGLPTTSEFSKIITSRGAKSDSLVDYAKMLAAEKYAGKPIETWEGSYWMKRGRELEPVAAQSYGFLHDCEPQVMGFITDDAGAYGCSPDRFIGDDTVLEIKCLSTVEHVNIILHRQRNEKMPSKYYQQTQGQLLVTERQHSHLFFFHPDLPPVLFKQERDEEFIAPLKSLLALTIFERDKVFDSILAA